MPVFVNGFNRFNQLHCLKEGLIQAECDKEVQIQVNDVLYSKSKIQELSLLYNCSLKYELMFSWSYCVFNNKDTFWFCGFLEDKSYTVKSVEAPNGNNILQSSCNRRQLLCVTDNGSLWQYSLKTGLWKNVTPILLAEVANEECSQFSISKVCCGESVTAILTTRGEVLNFSNKLRLPGVRIKDISCGRSHILMLSENGEVFTVGEGSRGQLGHGELEAEEEPRLVEALAGLTVMAIDCGSWHSCAVTADGDLYTWGWNVCGQLGVRTTKVSSGVSVQALPVAVDWPDDQDVNISSVACGARHTIALTEDGRVWGCGWNGYGQLSLSGVDSVDQMTRIAVPDGRSVRKVLCGPWNSCLFT